MLELFLSFLNYFHSKKTSTILYQLGFLTVQEARFCTFYKGSAGAPWDKIICQKIIQQAVRAKKESKLPDLPDLDLGFFQVSLAVAVGLFTLFYAAEHVCFLMPSRHIMILSLTEVQDITDPFDLSSLLVTWLLVFYNESDILYRGLGRSTCCALQAPTGNVHEAQAFPQFGICCMSFHDFREYHG